MEMAEVFPFLRHLNLPKLCKIDEIDFGRVDLAFVFAKLVDARVEGAREARQPLVGRGGQGDVPAGVLQIAFRPAGVELRRAVDSMLRPVRETMAITGGEPKE